MKLVPLGSTRIGEDWRRENPLMHRLPLFRKKHEGIAHNNWNGVQGLADDVRYYGKWMRNQAEKRIGYLYPKVAVTTEMAKERPDLDSLVGRELTVIAWIWARIVKSPNPAFANIEVPLASTFMLSNKPGKQAYVDAVTDGRR